MKLLMSEKVQYTVMIVVGVIAGISLYLAYLNLDGIKGWFSNIFNEQENSVQQDPNTIPYFASGPRDECLGEDCEWYFELFQPEVVRYETVDGLNYAVVSYSPDVNFTTSEEEFEVRVLVSSVGNNTDEDIEDLEEVTAQDLFRMISIYIRSYESFDWSKLDEEYTPNFIDFAELKTTFKEGDRIPMRVLARYPEDSIRTDNHCEEVRTVWVCKYVDLFPQFFGELSEFYEGKEVSNNFTLLLYSVADELSNLRDLSN